MSFTKKAILCSVCSRLAVCSQMGTLMEKPIQSAMYIYSTLCLYSVYTEKIAVRCTERLAVTYPKKDLFLNKISFARGSYKI